MNKPFLTLLSLEFRNQIKINNLVKYLFLFIAFCTISTTFVSNPQDIREFGIIFSVICIILAQLNLTPILLKTDMHDGTIESLLTIFTPWQISLAKFICLASCSSLAFVANIPILATLYSLNLQLALTLLLCGLLLACSSAAIICLIAAIQCYFKSNTNFLSILVMPIIIPIIIVTGLALQSSDGTPYLAILLGISFIITPIAIFLSQYLIANIYNI